MHGNPNSKNAKKYFKIFLVLFKCLEHTISNGRKILTSFRFFGKRLIFQYLQHEKVINLSSKFGRTQTFTTTNYGNSYLQLCYRIHHENY